MPLYQVIIFISLLFICGIMSSRCTMKLSVIIPCKNEEENVKGLYEKISGVLDKVKYEIIYIDDGSTDDTLKNLRKLHSDDVLHVKYISFSG